jgi:hypothetical protein
MPESLPSQLRCRPWREIAHDLTHESNRKRIIELSYELNLALEEQGIGAGQPPSIKKKDAVVGFYRA